MPRLFHEICSPERGIFAGIEPESRAGDDESGVEKTVFWKARDAVIVQFPGAGGDSGGNFPTRWNRRRM